jgi:hypothetical protein
LFLVYILTQLTILGDRLATLVQELAIERARLRGSEREPKDDGGSRSTS